MGQKDKETEIERMCVCVCTFALSPSWNGAESLTLTPLVTQGHHPFMWTTYGRPRLVE